MKKKSFIVLLALVLTISLCACGSSDDKGGTEATEPTEPTIDYTELQRDMSNFMCEGLYTVHDGWIYTIRFPEEGGLGFLAKQRTDGTELSKLSSVGAPKRIYVEGEFIYALLVNETSSYIYRCRLGGDDIKQITADNVNSMQLVGDYVYYNKFDFNTGATLGYYRCNRDGSNEELVLEKTTYYNYIIGNELYYQDDNDGETIHKYNLETKEDTRITDGITYTFITDGKYFYYIKNDKSAAEGDHEGNLVKMDIDTKEETVLYEGACTSDLLVMDDVIYFINANDNNRIYSIGKDGDGIKLIAQDTNCTRLANYGDYLLYADFDSEYRYVEHIYICNLDGSDKVVISE